MKNLTTLKELEEFCKENGLLFVKGEKKGFLITLNTNIYISKEICCGRYHNMNVKVDQYDDNKIVVVKQSLDDLDGYIRLETRTYGKVIATFLYDYDTTLLIFRKGNFWEECNEFYLTDGE